MADIGSYNAKTNSLIKLANELMQHYANSSDEKKKEYEMALDQLAREIKNEAEQIITENEQIKSENEQIKSENEQIKSENTHIKHDAIALRNENILLREQNAILKQRLYGRKSEKLHHEEGPWLFDDLERAKQAEGEDPTVTVHVKAQTYERKKRGTRLTTSKELPVINIDHVMTAEEQSRYADAEIIELEPVEKRYIHELPSKYFIVNHIQHKYLIVRKNEDGSETKEFITALAPLTLLPGTMASSGLLAEIITRKFCDAIPLHRQEQLFTRHGIGISKQTMANWCMAAYEKLYPLYELFERELKQSPWINCDETTLQVMQEPGKPNTSPSYMWVCTGGGTDPAKPRVVLYHYQRNRGAEFITAFLKGYRGVFQSDGYRAYKEPLASRDILHAGCWAHARRRFYDAFVVANRKGPPGEMLELMRKLWDIEKELRAKYRCSESPKWDTAGFCDERERLLTPVFADIEAWLHKYHAITPPKTTLGEAIAYTLNELPCLKNYSKSPWLTPDNSVVERAIRPFTIGRKNWVVSGSPVGAAASACLYSFIETAKANNCEPYHYLRYIFDRLPTTPHDKLESLLPWNIDIRSIILAYSRSDAELSVKLNEQNQ